MAVITTAGARHSNAAPGENQTFRGDLYATPTQAVYPLGYRVALADGRVFRYAHFGAATNRGFLVSQDLSETSVVDTDNVMIAPASAVTTTDGTINNRFIEITLASVTADQFAGGYLLTTDDTGEGYTYRIKGNTATGNPATGNFRVELYDPLAIAIDTTTDFAIVGNMYHDVEVATAATDIAVSGVAVAVAAADDFGWVQTWGVCGVYTDGTIAVGDQVSLSDGVAGEVQVYGGGGTTGADLLAEQIVGYCIDAGDDTGTSAIFLQISP